MTIDEKFKTLKAEKRKGFIPYITAGVPNLEGTREFLMALEKAGADIIELGVPFSDPVADGPVIQRASELALAQGTTLQKVIDLVKRMRSEKTLTVPVVLFTYVNPVFRMGIEAFGQAAHAAGVDGVLIVDLPPEEAHEMYASFESHKLTPIYLTSPTTTPERLKDINARNGAQGFVYYVSRLGVTGVQKEVSQSLGLEVKRLRETIKAPIAVGFGVSTPEQAHTVAQYGDAVVVGSALVSLILENPSIENAKAALTGLVKKIVGALAGHATGHDKG